jgi:hypothetical protein
MPASLDALLRPASTFASSVYFYQFDRGPNILALEVRSKVGIADEEIIARRCLRAMPKKNTGLPTRPRPGLGAVRAKRRTLAISYRLDSQPGLARKEIA